MRVRSLLALAGLALVGSVVPDTLRAESLQVIDLHYRSAQEVIPVLQPLVEQGGALSGQDYKLFVRASAANVSQLRQAIAQIDVAARQLRVSVRTGDRQTLIAGGAAVSGRVTSNGVSGTVRATQAGTDGEGESVMTVQVMEGTAAFIESGSSIPVVTAGFTGRRERSSAGVVQYEDLRTGYLVTPRLASKGRVVIEVEQHAQRLGSNNNQITTQSLATQIAGGVGEWIELGGITSSSQEVRSGIASKRYETNAGDRLLWIRVDVDP